MTTPVHSKTFKSGNSVAVRLPKGFAIPAGADVELDQTGDTVTIRVTRNRDDERQALRALCADLEAIGRPADGVQKRPAFEAPVRPGL